MASRKKGAKNSDNLVLNMKDLIENIKSKKFSQFFKEPVDEVRDGAPGYYTVIKKPMDLGTMLHKLKTEQYTKVREVLEDFQQISKNCKEYNTDLKNPIHKKLEQFDQGVQKAWESNAEALKNAGIDVDTAVFNYTNIPTTVFDEIKMTKEQKSLLSNPLIQRTSSQTDSNTPFSSNAQTYGLYQTNNSTGAPVPQHISSRQRSSYQPGTYTEPPDLLSAQSNPYIANPSMQKAPSSNHMSQSTQSSHLAQGNSSSQYPQPSSYQPSYQPQFRPSYKPSSSQQSTTGNIGEGFGSGRPAATSDKSSFQIDLGQLGYRKKEENLTSNNGFDYSYGTQYDESRASQGLNTTNTSEHNFPLQSYSDQSFQNKGEKFESKNNLKPTKPQSEDDNERLFKELAKELNVRNAETAKDEDHVDTWNSFSPSMSFVEPTISKKDYHSTVNIRENTPQTKADQNFWSESFQKEEPMFSEYDKSYSMKDIAYPEDNTLKSQPLLNMDFDRENIAKKNEQSSSIPLTKPEIKPSQANSTTQESLKKKIDQKTGAKYDPFATEDVNKTNSQTKSAIKTGTSYQGEYSNSTVGGIEKIKKPSEGKSEPETFRKEQRKEQPTIPITKKNEFEDKSKQKPLPNRDMWEKTNEKPEKDDSEAKKNVFSIPLSIRQPSDKKSDTESSYKRDINREGSQSKTESHVKKIEVEPPRGIDGSQKAKSSINEFSKNQDITRNNLLTKSASSEVKAEKKLDKPFSSEKPKLVSSIPSNLNKSPERKDKEKSSNIISLTNKTPSEKNMFTAPSNKGRMEIESDKLLSMKKQERTPSDKGSDSSSKKYQGTDSKSKTNEKETKSTKMLTEDEDILGDLINDIVNQPSQTKIISGVYDTVHDDTQELDSVAQDSNFEERREEPKSPKSSFKKDKEKSLNLTKSGEKDRDRPSKNVQVDESKKKSSSNKIKIRLEDQYGEVLYQEPQPRQDLTSSKITFDHEAIKRDYEEFARKKVPKYIKKFQKHIKRLGLFFKELDIQDETLIKLRGEVEHLNLTDKSFNYSRVLLYLFNVLVYCKYYHEMKKVSKKNSRKVVNVVKKCFAYIREAIKLQYIKFSTEESETFEKNAKEYRSFVHAQVKQYRNPKQTTSEISGQLGKTQHPTIATFEGSYSDEMPSKIRIIQPSANTETRVVSKHHTNLHKKDSMGMKVKILAPQAKKVGKVDASQPKEETEEDIIKKEMIKYLNEIRNEYESKNLQEQIEKNINKTWKMFDEKSMKELEDTKRQLSEQSKDENKPSNIAPAAEMELENDNIFSQATPTVSFSLSREKRKTDSFGNYSMMQRRPSPKRPSAFRIDEEKDYRHQPTPLWKVNPSLFQKDKNLLNIFHTKSILDQYNIEGTINIELLNNPINTHAPIDQKIGLVMFTKIDDGVKQLLNKRGFDYQINTPSPNDPLLAKLVMMRIECRQARDRNINESSKQKELRLALKNPMSIEAFDKMQHLKDEKIESEIKLKDYDMIISPAHIKEIMQNNDFIEKILNKITREKWNFKENLALFYNYEYRFDEKTSVWLISLLMLVEDFCKLKLELNKKLIL